jgi:hypothetical protein
MIDIYQRRLVFGFRGSRRGVIYGAGGRNEERFERLGR